MIAVQSIELRVEEQLINKLIAIGADTQQFYVEEERHGPGGADQHVSGRDAKEEMRFKWLCMAISSLLTFLTFLTLHSLPLSPPLPLSLPHASAPRYVWTTM